MSKALEQFLTPEMREALNTQEGREALEALAARLTGHKSDPLYSDAREYFESVQGRQIAKGAAKYPKPLGASGWNLEQLVDHAMEEAVDQVHYLTALKQQGDKMAREIELGRMAIHLLESIFRQMPLEKDSEAEKILKSAKRDYDAFKFIHG